ncbi:MULTISPECIES: glycosyltransferase family 39 protein [unclassified Nodularia (in: cyanobacteria)]|uniref:glycosyltransferase family 39 protein n=1 Tax=unclassified Nodularia (in: cyanobacteria) TaxID=2656917 RepID=UPI001882F7D2|nr:MULTISPECIES: glycosyltransferase family 39 protein [unclassified Nodularia (in: cyanobacteria)]MBE9198460.1 glycosyltransferase family 39 protein [Nodularia sp. LEGE 06071]MCC2691075.1 glycosyltransferase family 39 protein [Nodularia sp. LEGE 04288]
MRNLILVPSWLRFSIIFLLAMGILFRFVNLEGKVYSHDETYTSLRISGYTVDDVKQQIFNGRVISQESFAKFQRPNLEKGFSDTIMSLATEDPQYPPLYYLIARLWVQIFGNSITVIRSLSGLISLLVFPCIYWLCRELFNVPLSVPWLAIALMAISPIHVLYAQEARADILWLVTIILCSAALLRAMRLESKEHHELAQGQQIPDRFATWGIYVVTLILSLYTSLWSIFIAVAHGIYVITTTRFQLTETVRAYLIASSLGFLAFMPWMMIVVANFFEFLISADVIKNETSLMPLISVWLMQVSRIFFDLNFSLENPLGYSIALIFLTLVGYAIYFLCRTTNYKTWFFLLILMIVPVIPKMLPNLFFGGIFFNSNLYLIPGYLGVQIAVAYLLATQIYNGIVLRRRIWQMILVLIVVCGLVSSRVSYEAETWWNKGISYGNPQIANIINQAESPLVISDSQGINYGNVFSLSYIVQPKVRFQLVQGQDIPDIPTGFTDIFLLNPSDIWRGELETRYKSTTNLVYSNNYYLLWKLVNPPI